MAAVTFYIWGCARAFAEGAAIIAAFLCLTRARRMSAFLFFGHVLNLPIVDAIGLKALQAVSTGRRLIFQAQRFGRFYTGGF